MPTTTYSNFEELLSATGEYVTVVHGNSMYPMVRYRKDPVRIVPSVHPLKPYDVAVYARPGRYVVHRVLESHPDHYVIRGDNCIAKEYVPLEDVRGMVAGFWRFGRYIPVTNRLYRAYARFWVMINPLVRVQRFIKRCCRFVIKRCRPNQCAGA